MNEQPRAQQVLLAVSAIVLWLITFGLGLYCIYLLKEIFYLVFVGLGGAMVKAERYSLGLIFVLGLAFTIFVIGSAEYHRTHIGTRASWRFFAWSLGTELSIVALYYIL